jgi:predicted P-loop ATPase
MSTSESTDAEAAPIVDLANARRVRRRRTFDGPDWLDGAVVDDRGRTLPVLRNVTLALRSAPEIAEAFAYDELDALVIVKRKLPLAEGAQGRTVAPPPRPLTDVDVSQVQEWLQYVGLPRIGAVIVHQAITLRAQERAFHPVRDYLKRLVWDGRPRLGTWLTRYLGAASRPYTDAIGTMFLTAAVARVFEPGCKVDYVLILEGQQGISKSSACGVLGGAWFTDSLPDVGRKTDAAQHLRRKWFVEISELSALSRAEVETLKAFLSRRVERYRPPYGRAEVVEPRSCVFMGTTNKETYLKDETGGRRFWPVRLGQIDLQALAADRDQLFAEAVIAYQRGEPWWPTANFERLHIRAEQDARREVDPWQEPIAAFLACRQSVTPGQVARQALRIDMPRVATSDMRRITAVLVALGWTRSERKDAAGNFPYFAP